MVQARPAFRQSDLLLSILIPTYNRSYCLPKLLDSLGRNGYFENPRVEIVIADNCSNDSTQAILRSYASCARIIRNSLNVEFQGNLIKLMHEARGRFLWIVGDDDVIEVNKELLLPLLANQSAPRMFVSAEEFCALRAISSSVTGLEPVVAPFGFISSTIQPNTQCLLDWLILYSQESLHRSPHFFARWEFFNSYGIDAVGSYGPVHCLISHWKTPNDALRSFGYRFYLLRTPWIDRTPYSWNWYNAQIKAKSTPGLRSAATAIALQERLWMLHAVRAYPIFSILYWHLRAPFLARRSFGYVVYMLSNLYALTLGLISHHLQLLLRC